MPLIQEKKPDAVDGSPRVPKRRSASRRRYRAAIAILTLLGLIGKTVSCDTQAIQAIVQALHHLHLFGF